MSGYAPLHEAVDKGHLDIVRWLIAKGVEINVQSKRGQTPLHICSARGYIDMAYALVENGADVDIKDGEGKRCYEIAENPIIENLLYGFSQEYMQGIDSEWDCGQTDVSSGLNFFMNFSQVAEFSNYLNIETLSGVFAPIEKEYCISFCLDLLQVVIPAGSSSSEETKRIEVWAACDFCQAIKYLVYSDFEQRIAILADRYDTRGMTSFVHVLAKKASQIGELFLVCQLSRGSDTAVKKFCEKPLSSDLDSTADNWKSILSHDNEVRRLAINRYPPKYPILMGSANWKIMFSFMLGFEFSLMKGEKSNSEASFESFSITPNISFTVGYPLLFKQLRRQFGMKTESYLKALGASCFLTRLFLFYNFVPFSSKDRKGDFFYSADPKVLLKKIEAEEYEALFTFLPSYYEHLEKNLFTFLPKYLGLYKVVYYGDTYHFVAELNMFSRAIHTNNLEHWGITPATKLLEIGYIKKAQFMERLEIDATLLQKSGFCDFRLLVGKLKSRRKSKKKFHNVPEGEGSVKSPKIKRSLFNVDDSQQLFPALDNGLLVEKEERIYYFRLIFSHPTKSHSGHSPRGVKKKFGRMVPFRSYLSDQKHGALMNQKQVFLHNIEGLFK